MKVLLTLQDVEPAIRLNAMLENEGLETEVVSPLDDMRAAIRRFRPDVVLFSGNLADTATLAMVREQLWNGAASVGLTDIAEEEHVERLRKAGFVEIFSKPVQYDEVVAGLKRILERRRLQTITGLIGESDAIREVMVQVEQMAPVTATVLIEGESGTGKELVARALHTLSGRKSKPFIAVNASALPETLLESELFGHEKGAFTGAAERRLGRFELADRGTIFLDEIGEVPVGTQVKLLRVLEERELMRVGGTSPITVNVRVVAATNRPLREHVERGEFRTDLFYRLNVLRISLPPLRERPEDVPILVRHFIQQYSQQHDRRFHGISAEAMQLLVEYAWPGNVRELRNLVESMVVLSPGHEIQPGDLPRQIREGGIARYLPVHVGPILRREESIGGSGRELEFIVRSLLELKLQVEELRQRVGLGAGVGGAVSDGWIGDVHPRGARGAISGGAREAPVSTGAQADSGDSGDSGVRGDSAGGDIAGDGERPTGGTALEAMAIEPLETQPPPNLVTVIPGMKMDDVEKAVIEAALKETKGNRRRAAELLGIGERTLYRKIRKYRVPETAYTLD